MKKIIFLTIILFVQSGIVSSQSNWIFQSPFPTACDLNSSFFINENTGWIVGTSGAVLKTTDGGTSFNQLYLSFETLHSVYFSSANTGWVAGSNGLILRTINGGLNWNAQSSGTSVTLRAIVFVTSNKGWAFGDEGVILHTTSSGLSWIAQNSGTTHDLRSADFTTLQNGFVVGTSGIILSTSNSGVNWITQTSGTSAQLNSISFGSQDTGYIAGEMNFHLRTTNAGLSWIADTLGQPFISINFFSGNHGSALYRGFFPGVFTTTNGGLNWSNASIMTPGPFVILNSIFYATENVAYITGISGIIHKTVDGGQNWFTLTPEPVYPRHDVFHRSVFFTSENTGWIAGHFFGHFADDSRIYKTTDGGLSWITQLDSVGQGSLNSMVMRSATTGFAVGDQRIFKTTNGGTTWINKASFGTYGFQSIALAGNTGWTVGQSGQIYRTINTGENWFVQSSGTTVSLNSVSTLGIIVGDGGTILKTTDQGSNWLLVNSGTTRNLNSIVIAVSGYGFAVGDSIILKTTNTGTSWSTIYTGGDVLKSVALPIPSTIQTAYVAGPEVILKTTNEGMTWNKQFSSEIVDLYSINVNSGNVWTVGTSNTRGVIMKSTTTGIVSKTLQLNALIEGLYNSNTNTMISDTATVRLRNSASPYAIADSSKKILDNAGSGSFEFFNALNTNYYLEVRHRNALETWSAAPLNFNSVSQAYDFTTSASTAFGNNLKQKGSRYVIYSGDVNADGIIDVSDLIKIYSDGVLMISGYVVSDLNGDSIVDVADLIIAYNNSINIISVIRP